jgi:DNA invertase Pin-like site-specific DNA recombinase
MPKLLILAFSYLRFSHPSQAEGDSVRRQTALRDAWLERHPDVTLDRSLTLEDRGISGFTGAHRSNPDRHALAGFLHAVENGRVPEGSYLIVENLDRLTREDIIPALSLCLDLIQAGVRIVQLAPIEMVFDRNANPMQIMMMIMELSRGNSESAAKSFRLTDAWKEKKRLAASDDRRPVTGRTPQWLRLVDAEGRPVKNAKDAVDWEVIGPALAAIRRMLQLARAGYGIGGITKRLNTEKVPPISRGKRAAKCWARSYVAKILGNRALVGEFQPYRKRKGERRQPDGPPIPGYYPAVATEEEWYAMRAAVASRKGKAGRPAKIRVNVFAGLLHDARDGGTLQQANKGKKSSGRVLVSYHGVQGLEGCRPVSFPFNTFERAILACLKEVDPREVLPREGDSPEDKVQALTGRIEELGAEVEKLKARLRVKYSDAVAEVLEQHEEEMKALVDERKAAQQEAACPLDEAWGECKTLLDAIDAAPDQEEARVRLRAALRRIVSGVWCLFVARGASRLAAVQVWFTGDGHRDYLILHKPATGGSVGVRPARWWVRSLPPALAGTTQFDLRKPGQAADLEQALLAADPTDLGAEG